MLWLIVLLFNVRMELNKAWRRTKEIILHTLSLMTLICWFCGYSYTKHWTKKKPIENKFMGDRVWRRIVFYFWGGGGGAAKKTKNKKPTKPKKTTNKKNNASEERGPDIPENPLFFCFLEVFGFLVVLVADKSFRNQKTKNLEENQKKQCLWTKSLAQTFLRMLCFFCFLSVFLEVLGFLVVLVADKSFRNQKPKENEENQKQQNNNGSKGNSWPKHSWESFFFSVLWCGLI